MAFEQHAYFLDVGFKASVMIVERDLLGNGDSGRLAIFHTVLCLAGCLPLSIHAYKLRIGLVAVSGHPRRDWLMAG